MYSTCLFCHRDLGRNEAVEQFPVGRRLAFDSEKGRLWVICTECERWNLTPLEERWEAVDTCERLFRAQRIRSQTENIGLVHVREGTQLVRIGQPLRPEFAAWRYGRTFETRFRRRAALLGGGAVVTGAAALAAPGYSVLAPTAAVLPFALLIGMPLLLVTTVGIQRGVRATRVLGEDGKVLRVFSADLERTRIISYSTSDDWRLSLQHSYGRQVLTGVRAARALGAILSRVNRGGATAGRVRDASTFIADAGSPARVFDLVAAESRRREGDFEMRLARFRRGDWIVHGPTEPFSLDRPAENWEPRNPGALPRLPAAQRLAVEMALHESSEQLALEGELAALEDAWREAEEIASIADSLLVPSAHTEYIAKHRP